MTIKLEHLSDFSSETLESSIAIIKKELERRINTEENKKAKEAASALKKYCNGHPYCEGCIFNAKTVCKLTETVPVAWKLEEV